ncbi:cell division protein FtsQ [Leifsonia sp. AK011]|uniref:FtsQ-type POTRA domain-containing protein n=1 Tax=Leifsonia sp. AK011 TaxID=2723075 RepID=UPI001791AD62|nr:FtsQ-type POTRA domain-containing protein [Leifsonia sp. AK011]NYF10605.1 cell division protein FtsQ [Leifsonia sp. AK011]
MKRPEGFDPPKAEPPQQRKQKKPVRTPATRQQSSTLAKESRVPASAPTERIPRPSRQPRPDAGSRAELKRAARERRKAERAEVRRFTRRTRNRRVALIAVAGVILTLIGIVLTAVYSPILALREVRIEGTSRINAQEVQDALGSQMGTPLALLDAGTIETQLAAFPLIRSYATQTVPPGTLVVTIVERQPVASVATPTGFSLVDPAGIVLQESAEPIAGVPFIDLAGAATDSPAFGAAVEVLLSLPPELLAQVQSVTAHTQDDVTLVLAGVGQRVTWGAADDSAKKAALLSALIAVTDPAQPGEFDVSAPTNGIFRPA